MVRRALVLALAVSMLGFVPGRAADPVKHTDVRFTMSDGVRLTSDIYLPGSGTAPFPCVVELTPYRKEMRAAEGVSYLPGQGIAVIEVDARGTGGSEGEYDIVFSVREQRDAAEIIEQAATTLTLPGVGKVCKEKVGMYGGSYSGIIQYLVATLPEPWYPQHLAAIAPQRAYGDLYRDIVYHGGQVIGSFGFAWSGATTGLYTQPPTDMPGADAREAWLDHLTMNDPMMVTYLSNPYDDATFQGQKLYQDSSALSRIENLKVPSLHMAGWFDAFTRGQMLTFEKALAQEQPSAPNYMIVGPWNHGQTHFITPDHGFKSMLGEWYRHWLDGAPAPAWMAGPRILYYRMGSGAHLDTTGSWKAEATWPPAETTYQKLYLRSGGALSPMAPAAGEPDAVYVANPTAGTAEIASRWDNALAGAAYVQWDQRTDSPKGLSYTTAPFASDVHVAGTMNLHLRATSIGAPDGPSVQAWPGAAQLVPPYHDTDFVVKVSDVAPDGTATLITQGYLRASHRALDESQTVRIGGEVVRAYHPHTAASLQAPGEKDTYEIEIWPTAKTFVAGHSLRIDLYSADTPNHLTLLKPAVNVVHHAAGAESWLMLPVVPA